LRIEPASGRLPSVVLGLHLERDGSQLRLYDPRTQQWLRTPREDREALELAEAEREREAESRKLAEAEVERLRKELEALRRNPPS
jgi:hypothetical protein